MRRGTPRTLPVGAGRESRPGVPRARMLGGIAFGPAAALVSLAALLGCGRGDVPSPDAAPAAAAEVRGSIAALIAADNRGDLDAVVSRYTVDAVLLGPSSPAVIGRMAIRDHYRGLFETYRFDVDFESEETRVAGDWAYDRGVTTGTLTPVDGSPVLTIHDRYLMILHRTGPDWQVARLMWNRDGNGS